MATDPNQIKLLNVRLSFPDIFEARSVDKDSDPKFGAHLLIDKEDQAEQIDAVKRLIWSLAKGKWAEKAAEMIKKGKIHKCLHEGSEKEYDGYSEDNMYVAASSSKRPLIVDRDRTPLAKEDGRPYGGCYVNAVIRLWVQDNQYGKRVNAELMGVQFVKDGEPFGGSAPLSEDAFEDLGEEGGGKGKKKSKKSEGENGGNGGEEDDEGIPF